MKNINWFKYRQYLGYAIDLGRIFPLLSKQSGLSTISSRLYYQLIEILNVIWILMLNIERQIFNFLVGLFPGWFYEFSLHKLINIRLETAIQFVLG
jgi:hypothetical protein